MSKDERIIRDPLYDYISYPKKGVVSDIIDSPEFQRLRAIKQLGFASYVFPNAEHTRFSHSLGAYHLAKKMDIFLTGEGGNEELYIAALLHDVGHLPLSHTFEKATSFEHEDKAAEMILSKETGINAAIVKHGYDPERIADLIVNPSEPVYQHHLISSQLDIDRFDYLRRDSYFTGNPTGLFDVERVMRMVQLNGKGDIRISDKGVASIENYLISRYSMYHQVYLHKTKVCFEEMLIMAIKRAKMLQSEGKLEVRSLFEQYIHGDPMSVEEFNAFTDNDVFMTLWSWSKESDPTLKTLAKMIIDRRPLKLLHSRNKEIGIAEYRELEKKARGPLLSNGYDPEYFFIVSEYKRMESYRPYGPDDETKENAILTVDEKDIQNMINILRGPKTTYIFVPEKCRE